MVERKNLRIAAAYATIVVAAILIIGTYLAGTSEARGSTRTEVSGVVKELDFKPSSGDLFVQIRFEDGTMILFRLPTREGGEPRLTDALQIGRAYLFIYDSDYYTLRDVRPIQER
jgi:hypothetical protein